MEKKRNAMFGAKKLMEKETVMRNEPMKPTTRHPSFFSTGGSRGPASSDEYEHSFAVPKSHTCNPFVQIGQYRVPLTARSCSLPNSFSRTL